MSSNKSLNPRNARTPGAGEQYYVIADGAPKHYVDGYGLVGSGAVVTLAPGVDPGRWYVEISPEDAAKAAASEADAQRLAVLAAAKIKAGGNQDDRKRKQALDETLQLQRIADEQARAQTEADGIARVAAADAKAQAAADEASAAKARADELQAQLDAANTALAAAQTQVASLSQATTAEADKKDGKSSSTK